MLDVAYKNLSFNGKVEGKPVISFGPQGDTFKVLSLAKSGDVFDITVTKNAGGYNDWVSAKKSLASDVDTSPAKDSSPTRPGPAYATPTSPKSTYETPEERAKKQIYIVRQSSLSNAIETLAVGAKRVDPKEVVTLAAVYENFVFGSSTTIDSGFPEDMTDSDIE